MSHFTVLTLVEGYTVEQVADENSGPLVELMAPYSESLEVEPYWREDDIDWALDEEQKKLSPEERLAVYLVKYPPGPNDEPYRVHDGKVEQQTTWNPNGNWDYWRIGGRWAGRLRLKEGAAGHLHELSYEWTFNSKHGGEDEEKPAPGTVDIARKGDIDIEGMRLEAVGRAEAEWQVYEQVVAKHPVPKSWRSVYQRTEAKVQAAITAGVLTDEEQGERSRELWEAGRREYYDQPAVKALKEIEPDAFFGPGIDRFLGKTKEEYVEAARLGALTCYAFLSRSCCNEHGWLAPGKMGWFGMSTDEDEDRIAYSRKVNEILDAASDDAVLAVLDCHV